MRRVTGFHELAAQTGLPPGRACGLAWQAGRVLFIRRMGNARMNNLHGIILIIISMGFFAMEDMFIKQLSGSLPVWQILMVLGLAGSAILGAAAFAQRQNPFAPQAWTPVLVIRTLSDAASAMSFATALSLVDLSTVAAVFQTTPLVVTMGAAIFFREQVGWRRWSAIGVGFSGVLLIIRPGMDGFEPSALLVLLAVMTIAARDLLTRIVDFTVSSTVMSFQGFVSLIIAAAGLSVLTPGAAAAPDGTGQLMLAGAVATGIIGYFSLVVGMRIGEASVVTPFRYSRLLFSIAAGMFMFGERPDTLTLLGSSLIIGSGLYTFLRERRAARLSLAAAA
jgi:drug/metabolite transporter (DMT)-like permease